MAKEQAPYYQEDVKIQIWKGCIHALRGTSSLRVLFLLLFSIYFNLMMSLQRVVGFLLFYMLQHYPNIRHAVINDVNSDLTTCYRTVRDMPEQLITSLMEIQNAYNELESEEGRKEFFLAVRDRYNEKNLEPLENTTKFFFLNRTCFNGLYRVCNSYPQEKC